MTFLRDEKAEKLKLKRPNGQLKLKLKGELSWPSGKLAFGKLAFGQAEKGS